MIKEIQESVKFIQSKVNVKPRFGIILGTGLGKLVDEVEITHELVYTNIPHFPVSTVESHFGRLIFGELEGQSVVVMQGRFHYYEGYSMEQVTFPVRVLKLLGIEKLFISNAAGGVNEQFEKGDLMIIKDHINLLPESPLRGRNIEAFGPRFPDLFNCYDPELRKRALEITLQYKIRAHEGIYLSTQGPNLETPAEYNFIRIIGADAVGMSTVPEVLVARHMNIPVFAISVITDLCYPSALKPVSIPEILEVAHKAEPNMTTIIKELIRQEG